MRARLLCLLGVMTALSVPAAAAAMQTPARPVLEPRASLTDVEDEVMCVSCNVALNIADAPQADRQRAEIRRLIDQGLTKEQIKDRLVDEYGPNVLALPERDGFGAAAYLVPIGVGILLVVLLLALLPRWRRRAVAATPTGAPAVVEVSPDDARRLDEDLARYDA